MKYLIVGLGNIGDEYAHTRHNIGFDTLDTLAEVSNVVFETKRYGDVASMKVKNHELLLLKPSTYMNLSGKAVRYWMDAEKIPLERVLVVVDDLALPVGALRLKGKGSAGGHNGLKNIESMVGSANYARLRFGIGSDFPQGGLVDFVLNRFSSEDRSVVDARMPVACDIVKSFCLAGLQNTMNEYNNK